ncbi:MAG: amino acid ABC transporter permease [Erysipelotrichaceae bacterium]
MLPSLFEGSITTLKVFFITLIVSLPLSFILAFINNRENRIINTIFWAFIYVERGTPLLLQLMFVYFGLPYLGITLSRDAAIYAAFILNYSAYFMEILRGGINAIDDGQFKAAKVLGLSQSFTFMQITLPQCIRNSLPSIGNEVLALVKDTSLITILGASELLKAGRSAVNVYATATPFIFVAIFYLLMTFVITKIMNYAEKRSAYYE